MIQRLDGVHNPNFKNAGWHECLVCKEKFKDYRKVAKYCSQSCYHHSPQMRERLKKMSLLPRKPRAKKNLPNNAFCRHCFNEFRTKPSHSASARYCSRQCKVAELVGKKRPRLEHRRTKICPQCKTEFNVPKSNPNTYCSYKCHLLSGGAVRAGLAAARMTRKYGAKKDANHNQIVEEFIQLGCCVHDCSSVGGGVPDLLVGLPDSYLCMYVEIKNPKTGYGRRGLNKNQKAFAANWTGGLMVVKDLGDVYTVVAKLKSWHRAIHQPYVMDDRN